MTFGAVSSLMRYLTSKEKRQIVEEWERAVAALPESVPDEGDERGFPDPPIINWCRRINMLNGVCTVQSCAGHRRVDGSLVSGHLWLRLSREMSTQLDRAALSLATQPCIEQVSRLY